MSNEYKDYRLEMMRIILKDWKYIPGKHIDEDRFQKEDNILSPFTAYKIFEKGKEEGKELILNDLKEFIKAQKYDEDKAKGEIGEVVSSLKALLDLWKEPYTEYELEYLLEKRQDVIVRAINLMSKWEETTKSC